ncbi:MAG: ABC transporter ATP-binding protein [Oscillospiraceae bacterium]|nr:ABC transporter ATP-binding protein [Oscillospiraceae bacterium]
MSILTLEHVQKFFGSRPVVKDLSFSVEEGRIFGFLGPNGAGKTTTIKMILGLLAADHGQITVCGHNVETEFEAAMACVGGIVENPDMYVYLSGYDNLKLQARACGMPLSRVDEVVEMVGMQLRIKDKFKTYSLGMKQRIGVAQAMLRRPRLLILDEPTNGLDPAGIKDFRDLLRYLAKNEGITVMVSSHILQEMQEMCDTVGIISNGQLLRIAGVDELTKNVSGRFRFFVRPLDTALELIRQHIADRIADVAADYIELRVSEEEVPTVNNKLIEAGIAIYGVQPVAVSLEESFIAITGGGNVIV